MSADRMRPRTLEEFVGPDHLIGEDFSVQGGPCGAGGTSPEVGHTGGAKRVGKRDPTHVVPVVDDEARSGPNPESPVRPPNTGTR